MDETAMRSLFDQVTGGSDALSHEGLQQILTMSSGAVPSAEEVAAQFQAIDRNGDGKIDEEEFVQWLLALERSNSNPEWSRQSSPQDWSRRASSQESSEGGPSLVLDGKSGKPRVTLTQDQEVSLRGNDSRRDSGSVSGSAEGSDLAREERRRDEEMRQNMSSKIDELEAELMKERHAKETLEDELEQIQKEKANQIRKEVNLSDLVPKEKYDELLKAEELAREELEALSREKHLWEIERNDLLAKGSGNGDGENNENWDTASSQIGTVSRLQSERKSWSRMQSENEEHREIFKVKELKDMMQRLTEKLTHTHSEEAVMEMGSIVQELAHDFGVVSENLSSEVSGRLQQFETAVNIQLATISEGIEQISLCGSPADAQNEAQNVDPSKLGVEMQFTDIKESICEEIKESVMRVCLELQEFRQDELDSSRRDAQDMQASIIKSMHHNIKGVISELQKVQETASDKAAAGMVKIVQEHMPTEAKVMGRLEDLHKEAQTWQTIHEELKEETNTITGAIAQVFQNCEELNDKIVEDVRDHSNAISDLVGQVLKVLAESSESSKQDFKMIREELADALKGFKKHGAGSGGGPQTSVLSAAVVDALNESGHSGGARKVEMPELLSAMREEVSIAMREIADSCARMTTVAHLANETGQGGRHVNLHVEALEELCTRLDSTLDANAKQSKRLAEELQKATTGATESSVDEILRALMDVRQDVVRDVKAVGRMSENNVNRVLDELRALKEDITSGAEGAGEVVEELKNLKVQLVSAGRASSSRTLTEIRELKKMHSTGGESSKRCLNELQELKLLHGDVGSHMMEAIRQLRAQVIHVTKTDCKKCSKQQEAIDELWRVWKRDTEARIKEMEWQLVEETRRWQILSEVSQGSPEVQHQLTTVQQALEQIGDEQCSRLRDQGSDIILESRLRMVRPGRVYCLASFPGLYGREFNQAGSLLSVASVACVFMTGYSVGRHEENPDDNKRRCYCHALYGGPEQCGCLWFKLWTKNIERAVKAGQILVVFFFEGQDRRGTADGNESSHGPSLGVGLGRSQKSEVAWLKERGYNFERRGMQDWQLYLETESGLMQDGMDRDEGGVLRVREAVAELEMAKVHDLEELIWCRCLGQEARQSSSKVAEQLQLRDWCTRDMASFQEQLINATAEPESESCADNPSLSMIAPDLGFQLPSAKPLSKFTPAIVGHCSHAACTSWVWIPELAARRSLLVRTPFSDTTGIYFECGYSAGSVAYRKASKPAAATQDFQHDMWLYRHRGLHWAIGDELGSADGCHFSPDASEALPERAAWPEGIIVAVRKPVDARAAPRMLRVTTPFPELEGGYEHARFEYEEYPVYFAEGNLKCMWHARAQGLWMISDGVGDTSAYNLAASEEVDPSRVPADAWQAQPFHVAAITWDGHDAADAGFFDRGFPADISSVCSDGHLRVRKISWVRAPKLNAAFSPALARHDRALPSFRQRTMHDPAKAFFACDVHPNDCLQEVGADARFAAAIGAFVEFPQSVERLFEPWSFSPEGKYVVYLYDVRLSKWREHVIDDLIPCLGDGTPVFSRPRGNALWLFLLEKAFAKLLGCYSNDLGADISFVWQALTGVEEQVTYQRELASATWRKYVVRPKRQREMIARSRRACPISRTDDAATDAELFDLMHRWHCEDYPIAALIREDLHEEVAHKDGLVHGHAYTLIRVAAIGEWRLVQLRNPWCEEQWRGDWGNSSSRWSHYPELACTLGFSREQDSLFWMSLEDFLARFGVIYVSPLAMPTRRGSHAVNRNRVSTCTALFGHQKGKEVDNSVGSVGRSMRAYGSGCSIEDISSPFAKSLTVSPREQSQSVPYTLAAAHIPQRGSEKIFPAEHAQNGSCAFGRSLISQRNPEIDFSPEPSSEFRAEHTHDVSLKAVSPFALELQTLRQKAAELTTHSAAVEGMRDKVIEKLQIMEKKRETVAAIQPEGCSLFDTAVGTEGCNRDASPDQLGTASSPALALHMLGGNQAEARESSALAASIRKQWDSVPQVLRNLVMEPRSRKIQTPLLSPRGAGRDAYGASPGMVTDVTAVETTEMPRPRIHAPGAAASSAPLGCNSCVDETSAPETPAAHAKRWHDVHMQLQEHLMLLQHHSDALSEPDAYETEQEVKTAAQDKDELQLNANQLDLFVCQSAEEAREVKQQTTMPRDHVLHLWQEELHRVPARGREQQLAHDHQEGLLQEQVLRLRYQPVHGLLQEHQMHRDSLQDFSETGRQSEGERHVLKDEVSEIPLATVTQSILFSLDALPQSSSSGTFPSAMASLVEDVISPEDDLERTNQSLSNQLQELRIWKDAAEKGKKNPSLSKDSPSATVSSQWLPTSPLPAAALTPSWPSLGVSSPCMEESYWWQQQQRELAQEASTLQQLLRQLPQPHSSPMSCPSPHMSIEASSPMPQSGLFEPTLVTDTARTVTTPTLARGS